jgi:hypothetical protein
MANGNMVSIEIRTALLLGKFWVARAKVFSVHGYDCWLEMFSVSIDWSPRVV